MAASGTIEIGGKPYTWTSPTFEALEQIEESGHRILDPAFFGSFRGRTHLLAACLKEHHPTINAGVLRKELRGVDFERVWAVICQAIPLWELPKASKTPGADTSSDSATDSGDGDQAKPEASE